LFILNVVEEIVLLASLQPTHMLQNAILKF
jgi:hypothetical protein